MATGVQDCRRLATGIVPYSSQARSLAKTCLDLTAETNDPVQFELLMEAVEVVDDALIHAIRPACDLKATDVGPLSAFKTAQDVILRFANGSDIALSARIKDEFEKARQRDDDDAKRQKSVLKGLQFLKREPSALVEVHICKGLPISSSGIEERVIPMKVGRDTGLETLLFRLIELGEATLQENPHFYRSLPTEYNAQTQHEPMSLTERIGSSSSPAVIYVLVEQKTRMFLECQYAPRAFGNSWMYGYTFLTQDVSGKISTIEAVCQQHLGDCASSYHGFVWSDFRRSIRVVEGPTSPGHTADPSSSHQNASVQDSWTPPSPSGSSNSTLADENDAPHAGEPTSDDVSDEQTIPPNSPTILVQTPILNESHIFPRKTKLTPRVTNVESRRSPLTIQPVHPSSILDSCPRTSTPSDIGPPDVPSAFPSPSSPDKICAREQYPSIDDRRNTSTTEDDELQSRDDQSLLRQAVGPVGEPHDSAASSCITLVSSTVSNTTEFAWEVVAAPVKTRRARWYNRLMNLLSGKR